VKYLPTPTVEIKNELLRSADVRLLVKLEYLNHDEISGNKLWKLKYNVEQAIREGKKTLLTFGGAYSNHIYATAACAKEFALKSIGIIRGEEVRPLNPTLQFARSCGMHLHFVSRTDYREKTSAEFLSKLSKSFGEFYLIPEGGTNFLAVKGCSEFGETEFENIPFDYLCVPVGTGGTIAGLISAFKDKKNIIGITVLKDGGFLKTDIEKLVFDFCGRRCVNWKLLTDYHHGGYAKTNDDLNSFIEDMLHQYNLPLDHVYTGKLIWGIMKEIEAGNFPRGSTILALHTGGLQGSFKTSA
jgi:1-aminocyclopropane-1-carboxylate deaminase